MSTDEGSWEIFHVKRIVDQCHVSRSNRQVIREVISRIKGGYQGWMTIEKETRKLVMRTAIERHQANIDIYIRVTTGRF